MKYIGIIDIGSNSIRFIIAELDENYNYKIIEDMKETIRLGMDLTRDGSLNTFRMKKAIETLAKFKAIYLTRNPCEIIAVATESVRRAGNQIEFLNKVKSELDIDIRVLTGEEEAYYDYFGVINNIAIEDALIVDIGGSSTEIILVNKRSLVNSVSLPFGAITLTNKFFLTEEMDPEKERKIYKYLQDYFKKLSWLKTHSPVPLIGVGGSFRNIGQISSRNNNSYSYLTNNYSMEPIEVLNIYHHIKNKTLNQRKQIKGLSKDRADIFLGAYSVIYSLLNLFNYSEVIISNSGIRQGLLLETIAKKKSI